MTYGELIDWKIDLATVSTITVDYGHNLILPLVYLSYNCDHCIWISVFKSANNSKSVYCVVLNVSFETFAYDSLGRLEPLCQFGIECLEAFKTRSHPRCTMIGFWVCIKCHNWGNKTFVLLNSSA